MKKKTRIFLMSICIILLSIVGIYLISLNTKAENNKDKESTNVGENIQQEDLINIVNCSEEFMGNYFEGIEKNNSDEEKENMLIIISPTKIKDTYGAKNIIEAPNNQYILQYNSEKEKNEAFEKLENDNSISSVEKNIVYTIEESNYNSWGIEKMDLDYAIESSNGNLGHSKDVTVAIIDTGCDIKLFNKYYNGKIVENYNVLDNSTSNMTDTDGHGTHIAGIIAEGTPDNVKILPVKVSTTGTMYNTDIVAAINYVTYNKKADVINMSFGSYYKSETIEQAINAANQKNIISVAAAGNDNTNKNHYPSALDNTISIASIDSELKKSSFSNYGDSITFAAPGTNIKSIMSKYASIAKKNGNSDGDDDHETISGTSMATPHAVAAVAILKSYNKNLTKENVIELLKEKSLDLGEKGWDQYFGFGLISFNDVQFCDSPVCDDTCKVYKDLNKDIFNIELNELKITDYNYYSITNLMGSKFNITYTDGTKEVVLLGDIPNVEILNYNPTAKETQEVTIKLGNMNININVINPKDFESGWEYNVLNQKDIQITGYKEHNLDINRLYIPETIESKNVSFSNNIKFEDYDKDFSKYEYVFLPKNLTKLSDYLFANTNIKYVYGDCTGIEVGNHAFESSSIINFSVPITKVGNSAFKDCYELLGVDISGQFSYISVSNTEIAKTSIGEYAFYNCKKLRKIIKSKYDTVYAEKIGESAFANCVSLEIFKVEPSSDIADYAFYNTYSLIDINLLQSYTIGSYAFYNSGISEANLGLIDIVSESAFENCRNLKRIAVTSGRIEKRAFWNSGIECISIGSIIEYISEDAFAYAPIKDFEVIVKGDNYNIEADVGIVENSTNKLIIGQSYNTKIPDHITEIGNYAFTGNSNLKKIIIPSNIKKIGSYAFKDCYQLSEVYVFGNNVEIGKESFKMMYEGEIKNENLIFYVHKNSEVKQYVVDNNIEYRHFEPDKYEVLNIKDKYISGQYFTIDNAPSVKLTYFEKEKREEIINYGEWAIGPISDGPLMIIQYQNPGGKLKYGDTYITLKIKNYLGYDVSTDEKVPIIVVKAIPNYTVPTNLNADIGQKLSEIELPEGFEWMDGTQIIEGVINSSGNITFKAKYIPKDTENYEIIENIEIQIKINKYVSYQYIEEKNQVIAKIVSNVELKDTKPTWKLSEDKKVYTKVFTTNTKYNTTIQDINGEITNLEINIDQIKTLQLEIKNIYNEENNEVTVQIISNIELEDTKPTWKLSEDKKIYTKMFKGNTEYTTTIKDIFGNTKEAKIKITEVKNMKIETKYDYNEETNQVIVKIISNVELKDTKPTWKLSEDRKTYTKIYSQNSTYTTRVESINEELANVQLNIVDVDDKGPEININYKYNSDNTVTIYMESNEKLRDTKPTWTLSTDRMTYEKTYSTDEENYITQVQDIYGNITEVRIVLKKKCEDLVLGNANVKIAYMYTADNNVIVQVISDKELENTKPTWLLSEDRKNYTKVFFYNQEYTTAFQFIDGERYDIKISISYF